MGCVTTLAVEFSGAGRTGPRYGHGPRQRERGHGAEKRAKSGTGSEGPAIFTTEPSSRLVTCRYKCTILAKLEGYFGKALLELVQLAQLEVD